MWTDEHDIVIAAPPARIWALFVDVENWPRWNAGIEAIVMHGPFGVGTTFTMQLPGQDPLASTLVAVEAEAGFTDETWVDATCVRVHHRIAKQASGGVRVTYATEITGPEAAEIGAMVTSDFPDVLAALKRIAEFA